MRPGHGPVEGMTEISVLMSTLTVDRWLLDAIDSILQQDDVDFEVVLVLDGATIDEEPAWMQDRRVQVIPLPRRTGLASALGVAAQHATGEFYARMDADDISLPGRLSTSQEYLRSHPEVCALGTAVRLIDADSRVVGSFSPTAGDDVRGALVTKNQIVHPSVMMRRSAFKQVGGYDPKLRRVEDYDLWLRMAMVGPVAVLPDECLLYRVHPLQSSREIRPYGPDVAAISRGQYRLARALGMSVAHASCSVLVWRAAQFARSAGVTMSGHDRAALRGRPTS